MNLIEWIILIVWAIGLFFSARQVVYYLASGKFIGRSSDKETVIKNRCKCCDFPISEEKEHCTECDNFFKYN